MADRRLAAQTEHRSTNTTKTGPSAHPAREDAAKPSATSAAPSVVVAAPSTVALAPANAADRRQSVSVFRRLSMSMGNSRKSSMSLLPNQPRPNTYRMEPDKEYRFRPYRIQAKILEVVVEQVKNQRYNAATVNDLVKNVTRSVHQLMKNFQLPRYKIIVQTVIGQKFEQLIRIASRCLWDPKTDNMLSVHHEVNDMIVVVTVHAVYCD